MGEHHTPRKPSSSGRLPAYNPLRLTARHFPSEIPATGEEHTQALQDQHQRTAPDTAHFWTLAQAYRLRLAPLSEIRLKKG
ncbi:hypothetical protein G5714_004633 [Onychostoma macrolepis]|uniref:Uncharacterized protein n=1 Tax=Onychostoma macrolepis TaxID=369639 RepID=A0A7J6D574_9TELE|nr:hypothetical protein G5714_004633 [Onychostoma macrolepis]